MENKKNYFEEITKLENLERAFLEVKEKYYNPITKEYCLGGLAKGIDGESFDDFEGNLQEKLNQVQRELISFKKVTPAINLKILKNNSKNKFRIISIFPLKEKVKHQAIYRVIEPILEEMYSNNLYSKKGKSAYLAVKKVRQMIVYSGKNYYASKIDICDYGDSIDHKILLGILSETFGDPELTKLFELILTQNRITGNEILKNEKGVMQGMSISSQLTNLYLSELDKKMEEKSVNYFRLGDDILALDENLENLKNNTAEIIDFLTHQRNLKINTEKTKIFSPTETFDYLGYEIGNHTIGISKPNLEKIRTNLKILLNKHTLKRKHGNEKQLGKVVSNLFPRRQIPNHFMWFKAFSLTKNPNQLKELDDYIENRLRIAYYGQNRLKNNFKLPITQLHKKNYISLTQMYFDITHGRKSFDNYIKKFKHAK